MQAHERWPGNQQQFPKPVTGVTDIAIAWDEPRIPDQHADWFRRIDPVLRAARELLAAGHSDSDELAAIDGRQRRRMAEALDFALASPAPDAATALDHVLA